jgi:hypothetical protein
MLDRKWRQSAKTNRWSLPIAAHNSPGLAVLSNALTSVFVAKSVSSFTKLVEHLRSPENRRAPGRRSVSSASAALPL